ncbi:MAG: DNA mismatch repair protein MutS [Thermodesulfatator sp.]|nr:MAG: DNA mismatch repair protein MutS [Thermodesulfatator sp.]
MQKFTPMFRQYLEIKRRYPEAILFFRLGDFYEMFFEDAEQAAQVLGIALTSRDAGGGRRVPMCGVPVSNAAPYLRKLVEAGYRVAICEQVEDPGEAKGLVRREVVRVVTPGLFLDPEALPEKEACYLAAISPDRRLGLALLDLSAGDFRVTELSETEELLNELFRIEPREILLPPKNEALQKRLAEVLPRTAFTELPREEFSPERARGLLAEHFGVHDAAGLGLSEMTAGLAALAAVLGYLAENEPGALERLSPPRPYFPGNYLVLDEPTKRNLELVRNQLDGSVRHSLLWVLDHTRTPMGGRTLRYWILYPLRDPEAIRERQAGVRFLLEDAPRRRRLREVLTRIGDLERLATRCALRLAGPRDLVALREALKRLPEVRELLPPEVPRRLGFLAASLSEFEDLRRRLETTLLEEVPASPKEGGLIRPGVHPELDELRDLKENALRYLSEIEARERARTGIPNLRVGFNRVFGYYIEVTKSHLSRVPKDYLRKQTLTNAERFITPELKEFEARVLSAEERIQALEYEIFLELREEVAEKAEDLRQTARALGEIDALAALAEVAERNSYVCPEITESPGLEIVEGRHPVLEKVLPAGNFVPNTVRLDPERHRLLIITGPNMAGKSTVLRQTALIVLMAHLGSFVPANSARIGLCDRIFSRIGASDELSRGRSTFMVEMAECANILRNATERSLVILDEIGRGTSTYDGLAIAWAVAEHLHRRRALTLLATHYHELTRLAEELPGVKNFNVAVKSWRDQVIFLYRLQPGPASRSYGVEVAALAGLPEEVVARAREILSVLERGASQIQPPTRERPRQLPLFDPFLPLKEKLLSLDLENLTPREALLLLFELRDLLEKSEVS